uniref:Uncharacterized protein n=1 Tax=Streptomyces sp. NBC_00049 TaxID=2903617 RepID=A0AAU2K093_9ACTN
MTVHNPDALARHIAQPIALLNDHLVAAPPRQAAQILSQILEPEDGILGQLTALMVTGSRCAGLRRPPGIPASARVVARRRR